mmetsp:Transcript_43921/g.73148  ORF Transcript_43921/g.73148 Transcript_43921/m.73148 type:complete len:264 (-) Transcript_43921:158-949(-)
MISLQHRIGFLQTAILQHGENSSKKGATPKQQTKHVMRMAEVSKTLRSTIHKYNNVVVHFPDSQYTVTSMEAITRGEYQWLVPRAEKCLDAGGGGLVRQIGVKEAWQLCEAFVRTHRTKNELRILHSEMRSFLKYYSDIREQLLYNVQDLSFAVEALVQLRFGGDESCDFQVPIEHAEASSSCQRQYVASDEPFLRGKLAIIQKYLHFVVRQLTEAQETFSHLINPMFLGVEAEGMSMHDRDRVETNGGSSVDNNLASNSDSD